MHKLDQRKEQILRILKRDKHTTQSRMAEECGVSIRTINTDLAYLKRHEYRIIIRHGRYGGGVYYED